MTTSYLLLVHREKGEVEPKAGNWSSTCTLVDGYLTIITGLSSHDHYIVSNSRARSPDLP
jgi:hypothetical protein